MTARKCPRLWQVEAVRGGRLAGNDLSNALRHRAECADCNHEARALAELGRQIKGLPAQPADALQRKRSRHALLRAWNEQLLAKGEPKARPRGALIAGCCAAFALSLAVAYARLRGHSQGGQPTAAFFQVVAKPGTRWAAHETPNVTRITLQEGLATFTVRRQTGQRLFIDLPDGEIEDLGTVFEVEVEKRRTVQVSVSRGTVFVRLNAQPGFELKAGQSWQAEPQRLATALPELARGPAPTSPAPSSSSTRRRVGQPQHEPATPPAAASSAEDDAYLHIVDLLRNGHELEARAKASQYLAQFPHGFRRAEVANIAGRWTQPSTTR